MSEGSARELVVAHYHLRPGGVRRVIEMALPSLVSGAEVRAVTLATGEAPEPGWLERLRAALGGTVVRVEVHAGLGYWSEGRRAADGSVERWCTGLLSRAGGERAVLWVHNLGLGRNVPAAVAWARAAEATGAVMLSHHHDFFFDNRWIRWPEMQACGVADLDEAARAVFAGGPRVAHLAINRADHRQLARGFGRRAVWLPNPVTAPRHGPGGVAEARAWLTARTGQAGAYWLLPCRLLRRKNMAEAVLLARWLRPGVRVVTTGATTSSDERPYEQWLQEGCRRHGWPLDLSVLAGADGAPPVSALLAGAEAVLLTSLQEGFGLPYLEAAAAERPLVARALPNVLPDLLALGLRVPTAYDEVTVPGDLFDRRAEQVRQQRLWESWRGSLPAAARALAGRPWLLDGGTEAVPFNRLTATAQGEVLARPAGDMAAALAAANPALAAWSGAGLPVASLGEEARAALCAEKFAGTFWSAVRTAVEEGRPEAEAPGGVLRAFLADRLRGENLYPLVFAPRS